MVWQRNDDQYGVSRKVTRIPRSKRLAAVGLDQLAMNYSVRAHTDGVLDENELDEVLAQPELIDALVTVERWHRAGHDCARCVQPPESGIVIHDFLVYNPDSASMAARTAEKSEGGREGNHRRWHAQRGISVPGCEWCARDNRSDNRSGSDVNPNRSPNPPGPGPVPKDLTDTKKNPKSGHLSNAGARKTDQKLLDRLRTEALIDAQRLGITDLPTVRDWLERSTGRTFTMGDAVELARDILSRAKGDVQDADRYLIGTCRKSPSRVREYAIARQVGVG